MGFVISNVGTQLSLLFQPGTVSCSFRSYRTQEASQCWLALAPTLLWSRTNGDADPHWLCA